MKATFGTETLQKAPLTSEDLTTEDNGTKGSLQPKVPADQTRIDQGGIGQTGIDPIGIDGAGEARGGRGDGECEKSSIETQPPLLALIGNPNTGKSTLFNRLTGTRQRVGNYPGVTVEQKIGKISLIQGGVSNDVTVDVPIIDLPGIYSFTTTSIDERIVVDILSASLAGVRQPTGIIYVVDANNLMRNLFLASQIADIGIPMIIALNMCDETAKKGIIIKHDRLSEILGIPVIPIVATSGKGIDSLKQAIVGMLQSPRLMARMSWPSDIQKELDVISKEISGRQSGDSCGVAPECGTGVETGSVKTGLHSNSTPRDVEIQRLLFDKDSAILSRLEPQHSSLSKLIDECRTRVENCTGHSMSQLEPVTRYCALKDIINQVVSHETGDVPSYSDRIDSVLTHRFFGLLFFVLVMGLVFQAIYSFATPIMDVVDLAFSALGELASVVLADMPVLQSLVVDGVIAGVGGVMIFLPQILLLFCFIALLEDSGYLTRAAYMMDRALGWCGLSGKSFVPLLSSYACAIPGVMATRTIENRSVRLATILIAPLMSCSARLPVYVLFIGAFIEPAWGQMWAGIALLGMHLVGLVVAVPCAFVITRFLGRRSARVPFVMEMPPYRRPQLFNVMLRMYERGKVFVLEAGPVILAMSVLVWALCYFPHSDDVKDQAERNYVANYKIENTMPGGTTSASVSPDAQSEDELLAYLLSDPAHAARIDSAINAAHLENSYIGTIGKAIQPIFAPAGFDWRITVGILASFPAREVVISTLGIIYKLEGGADEDSQGLASAMRASTWDSPDTSLHNRPVYSPLLAIGIMVFFALCMQCGATVAIIARESSWGWALFSFCYMTALAWVGAVAVHQLGNLFA